MLHVQPTVARIRPLATLDVNGQTTNCSVTLNRNSHRVIVRLNLLPLLVCLLAFIHHRIIVLSYFPWTLSIVFC